MPATWGALDLGGDARLLEEHLDELGLGGEVRMDDLDRDELLEAGVAGGATEVHGRHPAVTEALDDLVAPERASGRHGVTGRDVRRVRVTGRQHLGLGFGLHEQAMRRDEGPAPRTVRGARDFTTIRQSSRTITRKRSAAPPVGVFPGN
jgi:hypothetical protein